MKLYRAVIENNISPKKDGRVQVRVIGIHDEKLKNVKTEHLPWAEVMQSTAFGFSSGVGFSSIPNIGTWVFVTMDHENPNMFIVLGAISGKSTKKADKTVGFNSPDGVFPLEDRLNEEDQNRLQRVDKLEETIHKKINDTLDIFTKTDGVSGADVSMTEPSSLSNLSKYPDNAVIETKSGHVIEIDDTPGNEKIRMYHKTGTYIDYRPDGSISKKVMKNINKIVEGYVDTHIKLGVKNYIEENLDEIILGGIRQSVEMDNFQHIAGFFKIQADGNLLINNDVKIDGNLEVTKKITANKDISSKAEIADFKGNLSSLRDKHDANVAVYNSHTHNSSDPAHHPVTVVPNQTEANDPKTRWGDYTWSNTPKGFK